MGWIGCLWQVGPVGFLFRREDADAEWVLDLVVRAICRCGCVWIPSVVRRAGKAFPLVGGGSPFSVVVLVGAGRRASREAVSEMLRSAAGLGVGMGCFLATE